MNQLKPSQGILSDLLIQQVMLWMSADSDFSIIVFYQDGFYRIYDGHHRAYCWWKLNQKTIKIELIETTESVLQEVSIFKHPFVKEWADLQIWPHYEFQNAARGLQAE